METEKHSEDEATEVDEQAVKIKFREDEDDASEVEEQRRPVRREDEDEGDSDDDDGDSDVDEQRAFSDATLKGEISPIASSLRKLA